MKIWKLLFVFCLFYACNDEIASVNDPEGPEPQTVSDPQFVLNNFGDSVSHDFVGLVVNQSGERLQDVQISIGNESALTDQYGVFILNDVNVFEKFALVKAQKEGYLLGSRAIVPTSGKNDIKIVLLDKEITASVMSGEPSLVLQQSTGVQIEFDGVFIDQSGNDYSGQVDVSIHYLEPNTSSTFLEMPGMLFGKREDGSAAALETYGMVAINLFSPNGEALNINPDTTAEITIPLASSTSSAPLEIPVWFFDETTGYWKEQGVSNTINNTYVAEVSHFSWWNIDAPIETITACFELRHDDPLPNVYFEIIRNNSGQTLFSGNTNEIGLECGLLPKDENLTINIYGLQSCSDDIIHSESIGPFSTDTDFIINLSQLPFNLIQTTISASVNDCNDNPLANGYGLFFNTNATNFADYEILPITNGLLNYNTTYCNNGIYNLIIVDQDTDEGIELENINLAPTTTDLETISICGTLEIIFTGNVTLLSQQDVDDFGLFGYTKIEGILRIGSSNNGTDITNLFALQDLTEVTNSIRIRNNPILETLNGLNNIITSPWISITGNNSLVSLEGLDSLNDVGLFGVYNCSAMTSLTGLNSLTTAETLAFGDNNMLTNLDGLQNISDVYHLDLYNNIGLESIQGLPSFLSNGSIWLSSPNILSLEGAEHITELRELLIGVISITSLEGLNNLVTLDYLSCVSNEFLTDFCALQNLFINGTYETVNISDNAYNPTVQDIIDGNCAQ